MFNFFFFFQAEDGIRDLIVTGVQTCALPISLGKEALFKAVVRETIVPVIAQGEALARSFTGSARELLERLVREYWRFFGGRCLRGSLQSLKGRSGHLSSRLALYCVKRCGPRPAPVSRA